MAIWVVSSAIAAFCVFGQIADCAKERHGCAKETRIGVDRKSAGLLAKRTPGGAPRVRHARPKRSALPFGCGARGGRRGRLRALAGGPRSPGFPPSLPPRPRALAGVATVDPAGVGREELSKVPGGPKGLRYGRPPSGGGPRDGGPSRCGRRCARPRPNARRRPPSAPAATPRARGPARFRPRRALSSRPRLFAADQTLVASPEYRCLLSE